MASVNRSRCNRVALEYGAWNRNHQTPCPPCHRAKRLREYQRLEQAVKEYDALVLQEWLESRRQQKLREYKAQKEAWSKVKVQECQDYVALVEEGKEPLIEWTFHKALSIIENAANRPKSAQLSPLTSTFQPESNNQSAPAESISKDQTQ